MAQFEDAAAGWEIFRTRSAAVSRTQLNQALRSQGREPIALRTFNHYRKLYRLGYSEYVSINRLDVRHANDSVFDISDRSRYLDRASDSPARLVLPEERHVTVFKGTVGKVSEGFAVLRIQDKEAGVRAARATKYNRGVLVFDQVGVERPVRVTEAIERGSAVDLLLEFRSLLETDLVLPQSPYALAESSLTVNLGPEASLYRVLDSIHVCFDLFESVRGLVDVIADDSDSQDSPRTPTPRVRSLQFSNPLELLLFGAVPVAAGVGYIVKRVANSVSDVAGAASAVQGVQHAASTEKRREERHRVEMQSLQLDNLKKSIEVAELLHAVEPGIVDAINADLPQLSEAATERAHALKDQAVEAAAELEIGTETPISFETSDSLGVDDEDN